MESDPKCDGCMNRRDFLLVSLAAAAAAGCQGMGGGGSSATSAGALRVLDAGPAAAYAADGVYSNFRDLGFFLIRRGGKLEAISSLCTHRACKLDTEPDHSFYCHCHGSTFDPDGKVTEGPATRNLPILATFTTDAGRLMVRVPA